LLLFGLRNGSQQLLRPRPRRYKSSSARSGHMALISCVRWRISTATRMSCLQR
jgi:hypothetical protein